MWKDIHYKGLASVTLETERSHGLPAVCNLKNQERGRPQSRPEGPGTREANGSGVSPSAKAQDEEHEVRGQRADVSAQANSPSLCRFVPLRPSVD